MDILITNDDGIESPGIAVLSRELGRIGDVTVVAPASQKSASGHSLTIDSPIRYTEVFRDGRLFGYAVEGTPVDCVKTALNVISARKPDLIVSGINMGANLGWNVFYSGTVSAASEGVLKGIPSIAVSLDKFKAEKEEEFYFAAEFACRTAGELLSGCIPGDVLVNINVPAIPRAEIKGVKYTFQSGVAFNEAMKKQTDSSGKDYYCLYSKEDEDRFEEGSDCKAVREGYISVTPLRFDLTDYKVLASMEKDLTAAGRDKHLF